MFLFVYLLIMDYQNHFITLIQNNKLEEIIPFYEQHKQHIDICDENEQAFRIACVYGHLKVAQWLYKIKPTIDISAWNEWAFRWACVHGHLKVARWLYEIRPTIDISANNEDNEYAFIWACEYGHLEVAQWLYKIKPTIDISAENEYAFRYACQNGKLDVAQWLQTLIPYGLYYTFEVDENNKITSYSTKKINYSFLKKRLDYLHSGNEICFREALVRNRFHPKYMDKWVDWGHEEAEDFDMME
jgi:ankyrin repeat protein